MKKNRFKTSIKVKIAEFVIKIIFGPCETKLKKNLLRKQILKALSLFIFENPKSKADFTIYIKERKGITFFKRNLERINKVFKVYYNTFFILDVSADTIIADYNISLFQFEHILNVVIHKLIFKHQGLLIHSSAVNYNNKAILFMGKPGSGKTTISRLFSKIYEVFADDSVIIRKIDGKIYAYQTPLTEKNSSIKRGSKGLPVCACCFLRKSRNVSIQKILNNEYILSRFTKQIFRSSKEVGRYIRQILIVIKSTSFYLVKFNLKEDDVLNAFSLLENLR